MHTKFVEQTTMLTPCGMVGTWEAVLDNSDIMRQLCWDTPGLSVQKVLITKGKGFEDTAVWQSS